MFDSVDFYRLAGSLYQTGENESSFRTAIGRAYYGVFLQARTRSGIDGYQSNTHERVPEFFRANNQPAIGNGLKALRVLRNYADYDLRRQITSRDAIVAIKKAEVLFREMGIDVPKATDFNRPGSGG